jgi:hypothetical protein
VVTPHTLAEGDHKDLVALCRKERSDHLKEEYLAPNKGNHHALVAINSSYDSWIIYFGASHHGDKNKTYISNGSERGSFHFIEFILKIYGIHHGG